MFKVIILVLSVLFIFLLGYFLMPTMSYGFYGIPFLITIFGIILYIVNKKVSIGVTLVGIIGLIVLPFITSSAILFNADDYRNIIGDVKTSNFTNDIAPVDIDKVRIVDQDMAEKLGSKILGNDASLGSRAILGEFNIQKVNNDLYWVAPLEHKGFFKWLNKPEGTPGFVMVSVSNERDVKLVQKLDNKEILIKYQKKAYFGDYIKRYVYLNGYITKGITDFTFEIDDDLNPYWVVTIYKKMVGYEGSDATGIVLVNAQTGKLKEYSIDSAPKWVDRIQPESFIVTQLNDWGKYIYGWINSVFTQDGVITTSEGISLVYGNDGKSYWYTGMTSTGSDGSTVGFTLVDTRTKQAYWYKQAGATENKARSSAEGMVQDKKYVATNPILYNISGIPTYIMSLKDNEGLIKMIAMVSVENYSIVGIGKDVKSSLRSYKSALSSKGNVVSMDSLTDSIKLESTISRINRDIRNGNTLYYLQLSDYKSKIFITDSTLSEKIVLTKIGDSVIVSYEEGGAGFINLNGFDNKSLNLDKTEKQKQKEIQYEKLQIKKAVVNTDKKWENLSSEDKEALLKTLK